MKKQFVLAMLALVLAGCGGGGGGEKVATPVPTLVPQPQVRLVCSVGDQVVLDLHVDQVLHQPDGIWIVRDSNLAKVDSGGAECVEAR